MRSVAVLVVALSGCGLTLPAAPAEAPAAAPANVAVVTSLKHTLHADDVSGCSAIDIGHGRVLTAKHCVEDDDPEKVIDIGEKTSLGTLVYKSPKRDFVLFVNQAWVKHPTATLRAPYLGEHVYAVGYPVQLATNTQELTVTDGVVSGPSDDEGALRFTAPIYFGNSGGGVWAEDGSLVGISVSGFLSMPGMNFMVSAEDVLKEI